MYARKLAYQLRTRTTKPITTTTGTLQKTYSQHGPNKETITLLTNHA